jgi:hypothetical protein
VSGTPLQADEPLTKGRIAGEILLVLGVSLGASAVYAIVNLIDFSTRPTSLGSQSVALNPSQSDRQVFDFIYQFLGIAFDLVPVALVVYILWQSATPHLDRLGVDFHRPWRDLGLGVVLALVIGTGGIGVYLVARALGLAVNISADSIPGYWWAIPILLVRFCCSRHFERRSRRSSSSSGTCTRGCVSSAGASGRSS